MVFDKFMVQLLSIKFNELHIGKRTGLGHFGNVMLIKVVKVSFYFSEIWNKYNRPTLQDMIQ